MSGRKKSHETRTDDDSDDEPKFIRNRFAYQDKKFDHNYYESLSVDRRKFGHKKYTEFTQNTGKMPSLREQLGQHPKWHHNLQDRSKSRGSCGLWLKRIAYFSMTVIGLISFFIQKLHPASKLKKIKTPDEIVHEKVSHLGVYLGRSDNVLPILFAALQDVGQILNESSLAERTLAEIQEQDIVPKIWKMIGSESSECESPVKQQLLMLALGLLHDISMAGGECAVHRNYAAKLFRHCTDVEDLNSLVCMLMIMATQTQHGLMSLNGIAKQMTSVLKRDNFGPWDLPPAKFFAVWSQMAQLGKQDEEAVCEFVDYAVKYQESWKKDFNAMMCLLSRNLKCNAFEKVDMEKLYKRDECREIFAHFSEQTKEL